jgi:hypothetical protein
MIKIRRDMKTQNNGVGIVFFLFLFLYFSSILYIMLRTCLQVTRMHYAEPIQRPNPYLFHDSETNVIHFSFSLLRYKDRYIF